MHRQAITIRTDFTTVVTGTPQTCNIQQPALRFASTENNLCPSPHLVLRDFTV